MATKDFVAALADAGEVIEDASEETFFLFSQSLPPNDLGIIDNAAGEIAIDINGREYIIAQSTSLLRSSRNAGTTGAVVWKVTPRMARWVASKDSLLWKRGLLTSTDNIVELGCGVAGLLGMVLSPLVSSYILTDQDYVLKLLRANIRSNERPFSNAKGSVKASSSTSSKQFDNLHIISFDWENDDVQNLKRVLPSEANIDAVLICDCIYNSFLIAPLTQTCVDICSMNLSRPTAFFIAQQLRTDDVFEEWLTRFLEEFWVWRIKDEVLPLDLQSSSGYVVHVALFRANHQRG